MWDATLPAQALFPQRASPWEGPPISPRDVRVRGTIARCCDLLPQRTMPPPTAISDGDRSHSACTSQTCPFGTVPPAPASTLPAH